jgi:hypothetical protein
VEGGHPGSRNAILNHAENLIIGEPLDSWVFRDAGRALATSPVETVTLGAAASKYLLAVAGEGMDWIILPLRLPKLHWHAEQRTSRPQIPTKRRCVPTFPLAVARRVPRIQSAGRRTVGSAGSLLPIRGQNDTEKGEYRDKSALLVTHSRYPAGKASTRWNTVPLLHFHPVKALSSVLQAQRRLEPRCIAIAVGVSTLCFRSRKNCNSILTSWVENVSDECANRAGLTSGDNFLLLLHRNGRDFYPRIVD